MSPRLYTVIIIAELIFVRSLHPFIHFLGTKAGSIALNRLNSIWINRCKDNHHGKEIVEGIFDEREVDLGQRWVLPCLVRFQQ